MPYLRARFITLWQDLGLPHPDLAAVADALIARYSAPERAYHNKDHLEDVLQKCDWAQKALALSGELEDLTPAARSRLFKTVELALWYHDAIYDAKAADNEAQSRDLLLADARRFRLPDDIAADAARLIDITAHHMKAATLDEKVISDCDLAILGADRAGFAAYDAAIRREYAHVPARLYKIGRRKVLRHFLDQPAIFKTRAFAETYEARARNNLTAAVHGSSFLERIKALIFRV